MSESLDILNQIINKGAIIGRCATLCLHDQVKADKFIKECAEQCHRKSAKKLWGENLTNAILNYSKKK